MHSAAFAVQYIGAGCHRTPCGDVSEPDHCCKSDRSALNGYSRSFIAGKGAAARIREPQWPVAVAWTSRFSHNVPQRHCAFQMTLASFNPFEDAENVASTSVGSAARQRKQDALAQERAASLKRRLADMAKRLSAQTSSNAVVRLPAEGIIQFHKEGATVSIQGGPNAASSSGASCNQRTDGILYCISAVRERRPANESGAPPFDLLVNGNLNGADSGVTITVKISRGALRKLPLLWELFEVCIVIAIIV